MITNGTENRRKIMNITLTINTENAAFKDNPGEIWRIIRNQREDIESGVFTQGKILRDINGNKIGELWIED
jgi:hypothetical protein